MKKWLSALLVLCLTISILPPFSVSAADAVSDPGVFLKQAPGSVTCTLVSSAMMLRRRAYLEGNTNWSSITESALRSTAWSGGLKWDFTYAGMRVVKGTFSGMSQAEKKSKLISLLSEHPEGIVIYMYGEGKKTHAVLATDYETSTGTVYCADPASGIAHGRIPLTQAYLTGSSQNERIGNLRMYWYVKSGNCSLTVPVPTPAPTPIAHVHAYSYKSDSLHPHAEYKYCSSCGDKQYTENASMVNDCSSCYPLGYLSFSRSFEKTKGRVTFYRNEVHNADKYTLKLYKNGSLYNTYNMSYEPYTVSGLPSGNYTATLYAQNTDTGAEKRSSCDSFRIVDTYTVSYNANGGKNAPSSQAKIEDTVLMLATDAPTRDHYVFKGWATSKKAIEAQYQPGDSYTKNAKITFYAVWEPETYTIQFDANGGKGELENVTITYGDTIRMPNSLVQDYYYLKGWATDKNASTPEYKLGIDYKLTANTTLYAIWGQSTWNNEVSESLVGSGTEADPYKISSSADLAFLANKVNSQTTAPVYKYYQLTDNINLGYAEWVPVGVYGNTHQYFYGSFDGNGYTISDLYITLENEGYVGLFGYVKDSEIKNLAVTGAIESITSTGAVHIGGIVGYAGNTALQKLSALYFNIGGISAGSEAYTRLGSIVGTADGGSVTECTSADSHIDLKAGRFETGMLAGYCGANIIDCAVTASAGGLFSSSASANAFRMGGLCGHLTKTAEKCTVKAPYFSNNIKTTAETSVGGLVGFLAGEAKVCAATFSDTEANTMTMSGTGATEMGGIAGQTASTAKISDCKFNGSSMSAVTASGETSVGGLVGKATAKTNPTVNVTGGQTLSRPSLPTKDGYKATWYTDAAMKTEYDFSQPVTADITLYAKWEEGDDTPDIWDGSSKEPAYDAGTKTYTITNGEELAWISDVTNGVITSGTNFPASTSFSGYIIKLSDDIFLNDTTDWENWESKAPVNKWKPIGMFSGEFYGSNIFGLYGDTGLFAYCKEGHISGINIRESYLVTNAVAGMIVATNEKGTIENCNNFSKIKTTAGAGGIVGNNEAGTVKNCSNYGEISGQGTDAGGIVATNNESCQINYCHNTANISGDFHSIGGIAGKNIGSRIEWCYNLGDIVSTRSSSIVSYAGGIAGRNDYVRSTSERSYIKNCHNVGLVKGNGDVGGLVAYNHSSYTTRSYNVKCPVGGTYNGSIAGYNVGTSLPSLVGDLSYTYANSEPLENSRGDYISTFNCLYRTSTAMKSLSNMPGLLTSDWATNPEINDGYPYLISLTETYRTFPITFIMDPDSSTINRSFANVDGDISGEASQNANVGGIIGYGYGTDNDASTAQNMITIADAVTASTSGSAYKAYAGNIIGNNEDGKFSFSNAYYNSEMNVESSSSTIETDGGTAKSEKTLNVAFYTNVLGLTPYTSLAGVNEDSSAVWVLKNGELPELYYNCLNDITVSEGIENGTISVDKAQAVDGEIVTVTATPAAGYVLNKIYVNGVEIAGTTFETAGKCDVFATFAEEIPAYSISVAADANATATLINADAVSLQSLGSTSLSASDGNEIRINAAANTDYTVDALYVNGEEIAGDSFILEANTVVTMAVTDIGTDIRATTNDAEDVSDYFATLSGSVSDTDEGTARYIRYWRADTPDAVYTTVVEEGGGAYTATVFDLSAETTYCYQMTEHGEIKTFTTCAAPDSDGFADVPVGTPPVTVSVCRKTVDGYTLSVESTEALPEGVILIGLYAGENELVAMKQIYCDGSTSYSATLPFRGAAMYAKVFVWNATGGMKPLGGAERVAVAIE